MLQITRNRKLAHYDCGDIRLTIRKSTLSLVKYTATLYYKRKFISASTKSDTKQEALEDLRDWIEWDLKEYNVKTIPELLVKLEGELNEN